MFLSSLFKKKTQAERDAEDRNKLDAQILAREYNLFLAKAGYADVLKCEKAKLKEGPAAGTIECEIKVDRKGIYGAEEYYDLAAAFAREMDGPKLDKTLPIASWKVNRNDGFLHIVFRDESVKNLEEKLHRAEEAVDIRYAAAPVSPSPDFPMG